LNKMSKIGGPAMTSPKLREAIARARRGEEIVYFVGKTYFNIAPKDVGKKDLPAVARQAMACYEMGLVALVQRRMTHGGADGIFSYIAVKM